MNLFQRIKRYLTRDAWLERHGIVYRRVLEYRHIEGKVIAELECGHQLIFVIHERSMMPCQICAGSPNGEKIEMEAQ